MEKIDDMLFPGTVSRAGKNPKFLLQGVYHGLRNSSWWKLIVKSAKATPSIEEMGILWQIANFPVSAL